jgi:tetratricopeptide (TPR) repeat protein
MFAHWEPGELALGRKAFKGYDGHFWGFLETRPYMRVRAGLAVTLLKLGEEDAAVDHFRAMLKLNPNDNQGIRYLLLACLLRRGDAEEVKALLSPYGDEWSAYWLYTRALIAYRSGEAAGAAAMKLVEETWSANQHVPSILAGASPPVVSRNGYVTVGGPDEAVAWLTSVAAAMPKNRQRGKTVR